jgi:DNA-binding GntR family transcriptional regulator
MPKKYGIREKDLIVAHIVDAVLTGKLRPGDRIDRNELAATLGLSRVPIQEAMGQLEHDGMILTRYHRGAFVERLDAATIREHHEIYGLLNGLAAERAAADPDCAIIERLEFLLEKLRTSTTAEPFREAVLAYRQTICDAYAGPRLAAVIRASRTCISPEYWTSHLDYHADIVTCYEAETDAIRHHDSSAARGVNIARASLLATIMVAELCERGVLTAAATPADA